MRKSSDPTDPEMTHGPVAKRQTDPVTNLVPVFQGHCKCRYLIIGI